MTGTVIRVMSDTNGQSFVSVEKTSVGVPNPAIAALPLDARTEPFLTFFGSGTAVAAKVVQDVGLAIYQALTSNPNILNVLNSVLMIDPARTEPIYLYLDSAAADEFPWEVICHGPAAGNREFLALDPRWPIGRIVGRAKSATTELPYAPPLRMLAVLAATGVTARTEWTAIHDTIRGSGVDIELLVLLCEKSLKDEIDALGDPKITTQFVIDGTRFRQTLTTFRPNLLHFFCHGLGGSFPTLQLATRVDFDANAPIGSVEIQPKDFSLAGGLRDSLWLVTLNCCEGAKSASSDVEPPAAGEPAAAPAPAAAPVSPSQGIHSFARSLVELWGFPAVVGMRERIAVTAASRFSRSFYGTMFDRLKGLLALTASPVSIEWVQMLSQPRSDLIAEGSLPWSLPVLYIRPEEFLIESAAADQTANQAELKVLRDFRNDVGNLLPPEKLEALNDKIRQLERQLAA